jgi:hypothetical protein
MQLGRNSPIGGEVAESPKGYCQVRDSIGFKGTKDFHKFLATDPKFSHTGRDRSKINGIVQNILPEIDSFFLKLPKAPYGVKNSIGWKGDDFGCYQRRLTSYYNYNGSDLKDRSLLDADCVDLP